MRLSGSTRKSLLRSSANQGAIEQLETEGVARAAGSTDQFAALIKRDIALWSTVVKDGRIKLE